MELIRRTDWAISMSWRALDVARWCDWSRASVGVLLRRVAGFGGTRMRDVMGKVESMRCLTHQPRKSCRIALANLLHVQRLILRIQDEIDPELRITSPEGDLAWLWFR